MKKILFAFAAAVMAFAVSAQVGKTFTYCDYTTVSSSWDLIEYRVLDEENKTCEVIGGPKMPPLDPTDPNAYPNRYITFNLKIPSVARDENGTEYTVVAIADESFRLYDYVKTVSIPATVTEIGINAFYGCTGINKLTLRAGLEKIGNSAFAQCQELTEVELPTTVTEIGTRTFFGCSKLQNVRLPYSIKTIPEAAFEKCEKLTDINLNYVELIEEGAFRDCHDRLLQGLVFGANLREIGHEAFRIEPGQYEADGYSPITVQALVPPTIYDDTFSGHDAIRVSVPGAAEAAYNADSQWSKYTIRRINEKGKTFTFDGLNYKVTDRTTAECTGYADDATAAEDLTIPATATDENGVQYTVTSIHRSAFKNNTTLSHLYLSATLETIGESAFEGCSQLLSYQFDNEPPALTLIDDRAFFGCRRLWNFTIPAGLTQIGDSAFEGCSSMDYVVIPPSVTIIGDDAFESCDLIKIALPKLEHNKSIPSLYTVYYDPEDVSIQHSGYVYNAACTTLLCAPVGFGLYSGPRTLTSIGDYAFAGCKMLESIDTYNSGITHVGNEAFKECSELKDANFLKSVTSIGNNAFEECWELTSVELSDGLTELGTGVFKNCYKLESAKLPSNLTKIPASTFYGCGLTSIEIPAGVTEIGELAFYYCSYLPGPTLPSGLQTIGDSAFSYCSMITGIVIPETVTSIGEEAFYWCPALTEIEVPAAVTSISDGMFSTCTALKTVTLHEGLTTIGRYAFGSCTSLESLELPSTVNSLGINVVYDCTALQSITSLAATPPACSNGVFSSANYKVPLFVNAGSVSAYKAASFWRNFNVYAIGDDPTSIPVMSIEGVPEEHEGATYATLRANLPLVWTSDNENVALVSNNGVVTAVAPGTATITATVHNHPELTDSHTLTITQQVSTGILDVTSEKMSVSVQPGVIVVNNVANGEIVNVYTISGTLHATATSAGESITIPVEPGKIYIVAVSGMALKVASR